MVGLIRVPQTQDLVQLPYEGYGPVASPRVMTVVCHLDLLGLQGLDIHMALVAGALVATLLHEVHHGHVDMFICLGGPVKLPLNFHITPDHDEVHGLLFYLVRGPGYCIQCWGGHHSDCCQGVRPQLWMLVQCPGGRFCPHGVLGGRSRVCRAAGPITCAHWA